MLPTLTEFIQTCFAKDPSKFLSDRSYVRHRGFRELYVRFSPCRIIRGERTQGPVLDIARVETRRKRKGTFKSLVQHLQETYPSLGIYVECVHAPGFDEGLERMGFLNATPEILVGANFYLPAREYASPQI